MTPTGTGVSQEMNIPGKCNEVSTAQRKERKQLVQSTATSQSLWLEDWIKVEESPGDAAEELGRADHVTRTQALWMINQ